jgi:hypothetical protein
MILVQLGDLQVMPLNVVQVVVRGVLPGRNVLLEHLNRMPRNLL